MLAKLESVPNRVLFAAYVVIAFCGVASLFYTVIGFCAGQWGASAAAGPCALLLIAFALFVRLLLQWKERPERVFLLVATPALLGFGLFILPDHIPDEIWHIHRVFSIEDRGSAMVVPSVLVQADLPSNYAELYRSIASSTSWSDVVGSDRDMSTYLTHLYLLPGLVVKLCALVGLNPFVAIYAARFTNAALFAVGGYWIVKLSPMAKVCVCVYLLNPMLIQQEASCSADALTNVITLLFIAYLMKVRFQDEVAAREWAILAVLFLATALSKYAYGLLVLLFLLLVPKVPSKRVRIGIYAGTGACLVLGLVFVAFFMTSATYQPTLDLIRNPIDLVSVLVKTAYEMGPIWVVQFGGFSLSNLDVNPWEPCFWAYMLVLLFSLVFNLGEKRSLGRWEKVGIVAVLVFVTVSIVLVFRDWTLRVDQRSDVIMGVQGRYFLPYFNLLLLCLSTPRASLVRKNCLVIYGAVIVCVYLLDLTALIRFFA